MRLLWGRHANLAFGSHLPWPVLHPCFPQGTPATGLEQGPAVGRRVRELAPPGQGPGLAPPVQVRVRGLAMVVRPLLIPKVSLRVLRRFQVVDLKVELPRFRELQCLEGVVVLDHSY